MGSMFREGRFYIPSNDFSCMISKEMFDSIFLEGMAAECNFCEQSMTVNGRHMVNTPVTSRIKPTS